MDLEGVVFPYTPQEFITLTLQPKNKDHENPYLVEASTRQT
jgi:hypothetical protein